MSEFYGTPRASVTARDQQQASPDIGITNNEREVLPAYHGTPNRMHMHSYQTPPYGRSYLEPYNGNTMSTSTLYAQPMDPVIAQKLDTLLTNLEEQKKMLLQSEKESKEVKKEVLEMKAELNELKKSVEESPIKHSGKSKQRVPRDVSHIVKTLHENASEEQKFDGSQGYSSEHNSNVRKFLLDNLKEKFKDT